MEVTTLSIIANIAAIALIVLLVFAAREWQSFVRQQTDALNKLADAVQHINTRVEVIDAKITRVVNPDPNE